jgi:glutathione synthase/RimK-type ligase-like ATP-grasp enzyme
VEDGLAPLLSELSKNFTIIKLGKEDLRFDNIVSQLPEGSVIFWRLVGEDHIRNANLAERLTKHGYKLVNSLDATTKANDKFLSYEILSEKGIPSIPTWVCAPGVKIPENHIVKPRFGAKGVDVLFGEITVDKVYEPVSNHALSENTGDWIMQPYVPDSGDWLRVIVVNGKAVSAYKRIPPEGKNIANVHQGATREYVNIEPDLAVLAVKTADALGLTISGIDITNKPYLIVEANSVPAIPQKAEREFVGEAVKFVMSNSLVRY